MLITVKLLFFYVAGAGNVAGWVLIHQQVMPIEPAIVAWPCWGNRVCNGWQECLQVQKRTTCRRRKIKLDSAQEKPGYQVGYLELTVGPGSINTKCFNLVRSRWSDEC